MTDCNDTITWSEVWMEVLAGLVIAAGSIALLAILFGVLGYLYGRG